MNEMKAALGRLIEDAGGVSELVTPRGYEHLGLVILDAVFSLRASYDSTVVPALERYCHATGTLSWAHRSTRVDPEHGATELRSFLGSMSLEDGCRILTWHVAPGTKRRKVEVVLEVADVLIGLSINDKEAFGNAVTSSSEVRKAVRGVNGIGPAAWQYMANLSGVQCVKSDTMVLRWIEKVTGSKSSQEVAARILEEATNGLQQDGLDVDVRTIDHLVWRAASGRKLGR